MNVGILGGAFDPPHVGHVELARRGIERFDLDRLRLVQEANARRRRRHVAASHLDRFQPPRPPPVEGEA